MYNLYATHGVVDIQQHYKYRAPIHSYEITDLFDRLAYELHKLDANLTTIESLLDEVLIDQAAEEKLSPGTGVEVEHRNSFQETI